MDWSKIYNFTWSKNWQIGDDSLDPYVKAGFEAQRNEKGGFWPGKQGVCKEKASRLAIDAIRNKAVDDAVKKGRQWEWSYSA